MKAFRVALVLILVMACAAFAAEKEKRTVTAAIGPDGVQRVDVEGGSYYFDPYRIIVKKGVPVELKAKKVTLISHDIVINAPEAGINVKENLSKEPKVIKFTPTKTGKYPVYCSKKPPFFKSHKERGMEGVIEVVE